MAAVGSYIAQVDLENAIGVTTLANLTDTEADPGLADEDIVQSLINAGEAEVNIYLAKRGYTVPITGTIPAILVRCSVDFAKLRLRSRKPECPDAWIDDYNVSKGIMELIGEGKLPLGVATEPATASRFSTLKTLDDRIFTDGTEGTDSEGDTPDTLADY